MATFQISSTGTNRKYALKSPTGSALMLELPSGITVNTDTTGTSPLGVADNFLVLWDVPDGAHLKWARIDCAALDGASSVDIDVILRVTNGTTTTDVTLWNAAAAFQSAVAKFLHLYDQYVKAVAGTGKIAQVGLLCNVAPGTPVAAGAISACLCYE